MPLNLPFLTKNTARKDAKQNKINQFISEVKTGALARSNRFGVEFSPPAGINPGNLRKILLFCDTVQLPGINYSTVQNRTFGEFREVPYEKLYEPINLTFYVDNDMQVKKLFDDWMSLISDPNTRTYSYYNTYIASKFVIEVQDINDKTRYQVELFEAYPKNVNAVSLDNASKDVMKLTVNMQYKYWVATPVTQLADDQKIPTSFIDKLTRNFTGFQETLNRTLGSTAGNFVTGSVLSYGVTKLPGLLKF
jgi:hypothetical protein